MIFLWNGSISHGAMPIFLMNDRNEDSKFLGCGVLYMKKCPRLSSVGCSFCKKEVFLAEIYVIRDDGGLLLMGKHIRFYNNERIQTKLTPFEKTKSVCHLKLNIFYHRGLLVQFGAQHSQAGSVLLHMSNGNFTVGADDLFRGDIIFP